MKLPVLQSWLDESFRSAAANMALDEALFERARCSGIAMARFYTWDAPAVTAGYFESPAEDPDKEVKTVRRLTGGGRVEHGEDLTFLLALPASSAPSRADASTRYRWIHESLAEALGRNGFPLALEESAPSPATGPCFANPVAWDLLDPGSGEKIGGGAQRRSRGAVIHQGSLRLPRELRSPAAEWIPAFLGAIAEDPVPLRESERRRAHLLATQLEKERYATPEWNRGPRRAHPNFGV